MFILTGEKVSMQNYFKNIYKDKNDVIHKK